MSRVQLIIDNEDDLVFIQRKLSPSEFDDAAYFDSTNDNRLDLVNEWADVDHTLQTAKVVLSPEKTEEVIEALKEIIEEIGYD